MTFDEYYKAIKMKDFSYMLKYKSFKLFQQ